MAVQFKWNFCMTCQSLKLLIILTILAKKITYFERKAFENQGRLKSDSRIVTKALAQNLLCIADDYKCIVGIDF